jgi:hypothetical protein
MSLIREDDDPWFCLGVLIACAVIGAYLYFTG